MLVWGMEAWEGLQVGNMDQQEKGLLERIGDCSRLFDDNPEFLFDREFVIERRIARMAYASGQASQSACHGRVDQQTV